MSNVKVKAPKKPVKPVIVVIYILLVILAVVIWHHFCGCYPYL